MGVLKRQKADGTWELVQLVSVDVVQLQARVATLEQKVLSLESQVTNFLKKNANETITGTVTFNPNTGRIVLPVGTDKYAT